MFCENKIDLLHDVRMCYAHPWRARAIFHERDREKLFIRRSGINRPKRIEQFYGSK